MIANVTCAQARVWLATNVTAQSTHKKIGKIFTIHTTRTTKIVTNFRRVKMAKNLITRQQYKNIKKMDHDKEQIDLDKFGTDHCV